MLKVLVASAALLAVAQVTADAQTVPSSRYVAKKGVVRANGRCNGVSYGTGARRCGSLSGGPSGGNTSRN